MADDRTQLSLPTRAKWRSWLKANHDQAREIWLVFYKQHTDRKWISYDAAVEEALCYGWVDSLVQRIDEDRFMRKFTPRKPTSKWSASNKRRIAALVAASRLAAPGKRVVEAAQRDGSWEVKPDAERSFAMPTELKRVLAKSREAGAAFESLAPSHRRLYVIWVASAKRAETRERRAKRAEEMLSKGETLGLM